MRQYKQREKVHGAKSSGDQAEASESPLSGVRQDLLNSSSNKL